MDGALWTEGRYDGSRYPRPPYGIRPARTRHLSRDPPTRQLERIVVVPSEWIERSDGEYWKLCGRGCPDRRAGRGRPSDPPDPGADDETREVDVEPQKKLLVPGMIAGVIGATMVAIWFLLVDVAAGAPFRTPAMIGSALMGIEGMETSPGLIALFTVIHFLAFAMVGWLAAWALSRLDRSPNVLMGMVLGFILFNAVFFGSAVVTGIDVVAQLGWVEVLVGNLLAGIVMVSFLHAAGVTQRVEWSEVLREGTVLREGLIAGIASGFLVATWFLIVDTLQGQPLFTPSALGSVLFLGATDLSQVEVSLWLAAAYTPVHYAVFIPIGILASAMVQQAERQPPLLIGVMLLFVAFQAFFLGLVAVVAEFLLGPLAWWNIAIGNLVGVLTIAGYLWKKHPKLAELMGPQSDRIEHPA